MVKEIEENNPSQMRNPASGRGSYFILQESRSVMHGFYKYLYWDENIPEEKRNRIKWRLKVSKRDKPCYVLTLSEGRDLLEIYNSVVLLQPYYRRNPRFVVGIAADYDGAASLVTRIAAECYAKNRNADLKKYLAERSE